MVCSDVAVAFVFFFQAEDGIRDKLVTGVQTCALPISCARERDLHMEGLRKTSSRTHSAEPVTHCAQGDDRNCLAGRRGRRIYLLGACGETGPASKEMMMTTRRQLQASSMRRLSEA